MPTYYPYLAYSHQQKAPPRSRRGRGRGKGQATGHHRLHHRLGRRQLQALLERQVTGLSLPHSFRPKQAPQGPRRHSPRLRYFHIVFVQSNKTHVMPISRLQKKEQDRRSNRVFEKCCASCICAQYDDNTAPDAIKDTLSQCERDHILALAICTYKYLAQVLPLTNLHTLQTT